MRPAAIVTGGSRGIGASTAILLAEQGFDVAIGYRADLASADAVVASCRARGAAAIAVRCDVAVEDDVVRLFEQVDAELGAPAVLVNNAGIVAEQSRVEAMSARRIERIMAVNVVGTLLASREAIRRMSTRAGGDGGAIVNVSSAASRLGSPGEYVD